MAGPHGRAARQSRSPGKPRPFGFRRNGLICFVARLANRMNYSLRRDASHLRPLRPKRGSCGTCSEVPYGPLRIVARCSGVESCSLARARRARRQRPAARRPRLAVLGRTDRGRRFSRRWFYVVRPSGRSRPCGEALVRPSNPPAACSRARTVRLNASAPAPSAAPPA